MPELNIELSYDSQDAIPESARGLYDEQDGKFVLTGVSGMKTSKDVTNVQEALRKEREDHATARTALKAWGDLKPEEVNAKLDRITELEAAASGKLDESAIEGIVSGRLTQATAPLERQVATLTESNTALQTENDTLKQQAERRDLNDIVRSAAAEMNAHGTAIQDIEMVAASYFERNEAGEFVTKADVQDVTPGVDIKQFLKEMQKKRPHWWPASEGGGAGGAGGGSNGVNPWSHDGWNLKEQGRVLNEQGRAVADRMAAAAGTRFGGSRPAK